MKKKIVSKVIILIILIIAILGSLYVLKMLTQEKEPEPFFDINHFNNIGEIKEGGIKDNFRVIGHAFGSTEEGYDYTNSYEALVYNYNKGLRAFEVDLAKTSTGEIVLLHEWNQYHEEFGLGELEGWTPESFEVFTSELIYEQYHGMSFKDLLEIMKAVPDFYVVIDSKTFDEASCDAIYKELIDLIKLEEDETLFNRFIPQAYNPETYTLIKNYGIFDEIILTLYSYYHISDGEKIYNFVRENQVEIVVLHMNDEWATRVIRDIRDYASYNVEWPNDMFRIYIHTINDLNTAIQIVEKENFWGIYSDVISEEELENALSIE